MANNFGTLNSAIILQEALASARKRKPLLTASATDFSAIPAHKSQKITTRNLGRSSVQDFGSTLPDITDTDVDITLNLFKQVGLKVTADEDQSTNRMLVKEHANDLIDTAVDYLVAQRAALYTVANFSAQVIEAVADVDETTIVNLRKALVDAGAPGELYLEVNSAVFAKLLTNPVVRSAYQKDSGENQVVQGGVINNLYGFANIYENPSLPTTENLIGFAGSKQATCLAVRPLKDPSASSDLPFPGKFQTFTDGDSKLSMSLIGSIDPDTLLQSYKAAFIAGFAKGNGAFGVRLISAALP